MTEIRLSRHLNKNQHFRIDAEFSSKEKVLAENLLEKSGGKPLSACKPKILHPKEIKRSYEEEGVWFFRAQNVRPLAINESNKVYISDDDAKTLASNEIRKHDILLTRTGANAGQCGLYDLTDRAVASSHTFIIRQKAFRQEFLAVFYNTKLVQSILFHSRYGGVQPELSPYYIERIPVFPASDSFQEAIARCIHKANQMNRESEKLFESASGCLLQKLDLADWTPPEDLAYQATASQAFTAGRLDAEFFEPKYLSLENKLLNLPYSCSRLGDLIGPLKNGADFRDFVVGGTPYIRVGDVKKGKILLESAKQVDVSSEDSGKDISLKLGDVLLTRKGSFGNAAVVEEEHLNSIISSEIMLLRILEKEILPGYLALFLNSTAGKLQAKRYAHGAAFYSVSQEDVNGFLIPIIPKTDQENLLSFWEKSKGFHVKSVKLLDRAVRAVETAIEEGEEAGMAYLADG